MADEEVVLVNSWQSPFGARVRIALEEKGVNYHYREEDLFSKSTFLLEMNPVHKKVPVLIHNGKPICESLVIVEYIDEVWKKNTSFLPSDPLQRAQASNIRKIWMSKGDELSTGKKVLLGSLRLLEQELGEKPYFGEEAFGFVDIALIGFYTRFHTVETIGRFSLEEECPKLVEWAKRCVAEKTSVSNCLPDPHKVLDFSLQLKKKLGLD
ncbi:hypothetical protein V2J09_003586 [Rumex salicifolius]